jgi:hypothetical protein
VNEPDGYIVDELNFDARGTFALRRNPRAPAAMQVSQSRPIASVPEWAVRKPMPLGLRLLQMALHYRDSYDPNDMVVRCLALRDERERRVRQLLDDVTTYGMSVSRDGERIDPTTP